MSKKFNIFKKTKIQKDSDSPILDWNESKKILIFIGNSYRMNDGKHICTIFVNTPNLKVESVISFVLLKDIDNIPRIIKEKPFEFTLDMIIEQPVLLEIVTRTGKTYKIYHTCCYEENGQISLYELTNNGAEKLLDQCHMLVNLNRTNNNVNDNNNNNKNVNNIGIKKDITSLNISLTGITFTKNGSSSGNNSGVSSPQTERSRSNTTNPTSNFRVNKESGPPTGSNNSISSLNLQNSDFWKQKAESELQKNSILLSPRSPREKTKEEDLQLKLDQASTNYQLAILKINYLESLVEDFRSKHEDYELNEQVFDDNQSLVDSQEDKPESTESEIVIGEKKIRKSSKQEYDY